MPAELPGTVRQKADELAQPTQGDQWLLRRGPPERHRRDVKVASDVHVVQRVHKAPGGLLRALIEPRGQTIASVSLSGSIETPGVSEVDWLAVLRAPPRSGMPS